MASTSFTRLSRKFSWEMIRLMVRYVPLLNELVFDWSICSRNMSEVPIGVRNSCDIVLV